jgi:hypothetical protein
MTVTPGLICKQRVEDRLRQEPGRDVGIPRGRFGLRVDVSSQVMEIMVPSADQSTESFDRV